MNMRKLIKLATVGLTIGGASSLVVPKPWSLFAAMVIGVAVGGVWHELEVTKRRSRSKTVRIPGLFVVLEEADNPSPTPHEPPRDLGSLGIRPWSLN